MINIVNMFWKVFYQNRAAILILLSACLLTGCGKKMSGRYEARPTVPQIVMPGTDARLQGQMNAQMDAIRDMNRGTLEFEGSKVRMGNGMVVMEYRYRVQGDRLELISEVMGQKVIIPMKIEADGSISYQSLRFYKVE